jgi:methylenetetrahydrofolate--tRNA-(uracil-5-)-methyltransferase
VHSPVIVIGAGLAGCELSVQLARRGIPVELWEMKPHKRTPAQRSDGMAELVCSNSLRSDNPENAVGLLKAELRALKSPILAAAEVTRVPAGDALAVDRERFSVEVERWVRSTPGVTVVQREADALPSPPQLAAVCTGPLTSEPLAQAIAAATGAGALYFYDALAPIVGSDSVDRSIAFAQSRYGKGQGDDYLNLPLDAAQYLAFVEELRKGEKVPAHDFEEPRYFEGCLPIEVLAQRGEAALAFGPMKPVGLIDPRTGRRPHAVVQLRNEDIGGTAFNLVGFQTRLTWPEQRRIFRGLPGMQNAEFLRLGQIHRNTFVNAPSALAPDLSLHALPNVFLAGQITGVEGYVESCACGSLVALALEARIKGLSFEPPPATTALGALYRHVTGEAHPAGYAYQPTNVTFGLFPPQEGRIPKQQRRQELVRRAQSDFARWLAPGRPQRALDAVRLEVRAPT